MIEAPDIALAFPPQFDPDLLRGASRTAGGCAGSRGRPGHHTRRSTWQYCVYQPGQGLQHTSTLHARQRSSPTALRERPPETPIRASMPSPTAARNSTASLWEDFIDVLYAPAQVFARRQTGRFGAALAILFVLYLIALLLIRPGMEPVFDAQRARATEVLRRNGVDDEQAAVVVNRSVVLQEYAFAPTGAIARVATVLLTAAGLWGFARLVGSGVGYGEVAAVTTYASVPGVLGLCMDAVIALFIDASRLTTPYTHTVGPARLLDPDAPLLVQALASRFDLFTLWTTVLLALGLRVAARIRRGPAAGGAVLMWVLGTTCVLLGAARQTAALSGP